MHEIKLGEIVVIWFGHASFVITDGERRIYIDPFVLPDNAKKADIILITHDHFDHFNPDKIKILRGKSTEVIGPFGVVSKLGFGIETKVGSRHSFGNIKIKSVEAYNNNKFRAPGQPFHPRGLGVGYVVEMNDIDIYHAGDTDDITEMRNLDSIDVALLPIGGTYTMTTHEAASAALAFKPRFLVPMHYNSEKYGISGIDADPEELAQMLAGKGIVVNILQPLI